MTVPDAGPPTLIGQAGAMPLSAGDLLDARDHLVDRLLDRNVVIDDTAHRLCPDVLVVEDRELVVLGEFECHRARAELVEHRLAMRVRLPERALLAALGYREPAAERAFDVRRQVLVLQQERDELLGALLVLRALEDHASLHRRTVYHL